MKIYQDKKLINPVTIIPETKDEIDSMCAVMHYVCSYMPDRFPVTKMAADIEGFLEHETTGWNDQEWEEIVENLELHIGKPR